MTDEIEKIYLTKNDVDDFLKEKNHFILDENNKVIPANLLEWAEFLEDAKDKRIVNKTKINDYEVSTVFIGFDYNSLSDKPHIFETMVFNKKDKPYTNYCDRYSTWKEAEEGHQKAIQWVKDGCKQEYNIDDEIIE